MKVKLINQLNEEKVVVPTWHPLQQSFHKDVFIKLNLTTSLIYLPQTLEYNVNKGRQFIKSASQKLIVGPKK